MSLHARAWSGNCIYVPWKIPAENRMIYGTAGDIGWNIDPEWNEIAISYGISQYRMESGFIVLNPFAKIADNLEQLRNICTEIRFKGTRKVSIRKK